MVSAPITGITAFIPGLLLSVCSAAASALVFVSIMGAVQYFVYRRWYRTLKKMQDMIVTEKGAEWFATKLKEIQPEDVKAN